MEFAPREEYNYVGCVMAVSAPNSELPEVLLPNATVMPNPYDPYVKRLVARGLLEKKSEPQPMMGV